MTEEPNGKVRFGAKEWVALVTPTLLLIFGAAHVNIRLSVLETSINEITTAVRRVDAQRETVAKNEQALQDTIRRINALERSRHIREEE